MSEEYRGVWPCPEDLHGCIMVCLLNSVTSSFVTISSEKQPDLMVKWQYESSKPVQGESAHTPLYAQNILEKLPWVLVSEIVSYSNHISWDMCIHMATYSSKDGLTLTVPP